MSALKKEREEEVRAEDAVEIIDCGRASERTRGGFQFLVMETTPPPFSWFGF